MKIHFTPQYDQMDCGPACLSMITSAYGKNIGVEYFRKVSFITREGVSLLGISEAAKSIGFETFAAKISIEKLKENKDVFPCILHWNQNHFVILINITRNFLTKKIYYHIADPAHGFIKIEEEKFYRSWLLENNKGICLFLQPTNKFYEINIKEQKKTSLKYLLKYLQPYKLQIFTIFSLILLGSLFTLCFPFLTQKLIDDGVNAKDINFTWLILLTQLGVFLGALTIEIFRNWLMLHIGTRLSIHIISDFLKKLLNLPIKFFDTKMMGDFNQRIQDNERIEEFLTSQSLITLFSIITFSVFFGVLLYYDYKILLVYLSLTIFSVLWSSFWLRKRKILDYYKFQQRSENQESIFEIINGVTEMKLNNFEDIKRKEWENSQLKLFKTNIRILRLDQIQLSGFNFLNQLKNIIVTFLAASYVIQDKMTLGVLLSISYIIGQMNSPVNQIVAFLRSYQDAKISLDRLNEIQLHSEEELYNHVNLDLDPVTNSENGIHFKNISFRYEGPKSPYILNNINFTIPQGKITAIVGASGSGKTTLMKLLLKFYQPSQGAIYYNGKNLNNISPKNLRENCGVVMQDGFIFSDTIERNIATGDEIINEQKIMKASNVANINDYIFNLPLNFKTKIGTAGNGISGGQKQRILIARAVYKNPHYIFFDEATSALDAENEKIIHDNLQEFFKGKTVLIIAHRLSTVKNADKIIVLKNGTIVEQGNHQQLTENKCEYYNLVKNQLELGD